MLLLRGAMRGAHSIVVFGCLFEPSPSATAPLAELCAFRRGNGERMKNGERDGERGRGRESQEWSWGDSERVRERKGSTTMTSQNVGAV